MAGIAISDGPFCLRATCDVAFEFIYSPYRETIGSNGNSRSDERSVETFMVLTVLCEKRLERCVLFDRDRVTGGLKRRLNSFGSLLCRFAESLTTGGMTIMSIDLVLRKADLRQVTCIVRKRQLNFYGHVARLHAEDPAHHHPFFLVEIRVAGPCRGGVHRLHNCVRWSPF